MILRARDKGDQATVRYIAGRVGLILCLLFPGLSYASGEYPQQVAVQLSEGVSPDVVADIVKDFGSKIVDNVANPAAGAGALLSVEKPASTQTAERMQSQLRSTTGVTHVGSDSCFNAYPVETASTQINFASDPAASVVDWVNGESIPWDGTGPVNMGVTAVGRAIAGAVGGAAEGTTGTSVTYGVPNQFTSTTTRTGQTQTRSTVGWTPPTSTPENPWEYVHKKYCEEPSVQKPSDPGQPIRVKLVSGPIAQFPYPRPIPLQIKAQDYDMLKVGCSGCEGGTSTLFKPIEDEIAVDKILWQATDKGALNEPFVDIEDLDSLERQIAEARKEIRRLAEEIAKKEQEKKELDDSRKKRRDDLKAEITKLKADKKEAEEVDKKTAEGELKALQEKLKTAEGDLKAAKDEIKTLEGQIADKQKKIDELQKKIDGEPSPEEQALADRLKAIEKELEQMRAELEDMKANQAAEEQKLANTYKQAKTALDDARARLANARAKVQAKQDEITAIENRLYANPVLREFITQRARVTLIGQQLGFNYLANAGLPVSPANAATSLANRVLQAATPELMQQAFDQFTVEKDRLLAELRGKCSALGGSDATACNQGVDDLADEFDAMSSSLQEAISNPGSLVDPQAYADLQKAKQELANLEAEVRAAEQEVKTAEQAVEQAQQAFITGLKQLEEQQLRLIDKINRLEEEANQVAAELNAAIERREIEREKKTPEWLAEIAGLRSEIEELRGKIADQRRKAQSAQEKITKLKAQIEIKKAQIDEINARIANLEALIAQKEAELAALDTEEDRLQKEIDELIEQKKAQEAILRDLQSRGSSATNKNQKATGQVVYYIPPPLEVLLPAKKKEEFKQHKLKVADAQAKLEEEIGKKAALQDRAFKILKGMATQLLAYKSAKERIQKLEDEIKKLKAEKADKESELAKGQLEQMRKEEAKKGELDEKKKAADKELEKAKAEEKREKGEVTDAQDASDARADEEKALKENYDAKTNELELQIKQRRAKKSTLDDKKATHDQTTTKMRNQEAELGRINDSIARQSAAGNETGAANLREAARVAQRELDNIKKNFEQEQRDLKVAGDDLKLAVVAEERVAQELYTIGNDLQNKRDETRKARQELRKQTEELDKVTEERLAAERDARLADDAVKDQDEKIKQTKDEKAAEDDDVKSKEKEIAKKEKEKAEAEGAKNTAKVELDKLVAQRDEWQQDRDKANDAVKAARDALKGAEQSLKTFISGEFNNINYTETIKVSVDDVVLGGKDGWRGDDPPRSDISFQIKYGGASGTTTVVRGAGSREAKIINAPDEDLKPPKKIHTAAKCDVSVSFESDKKIEIDPDPQPKDPLKPEPVKLKGVEPQTIALFYKEGQPLYEEWPPRRDPAPTMQKAAAHWETEASDTDKFTIECKPEGGFAYAVGASMLGETQEPSGEFCGPGKATTEDIEDVTHASWAAPNYTNLEEKTLHLRAPKVPEDKCSADVHLIVGYKNTDSDIEKGLDADEEALQAQDTEKKEADFTGIKAGMVGDFEHKFGSFDGKISDFGPDNKVELRIQLFDGAHRGLDKETVEWEVTSTAPKEKYGFGSNKQKKLTAHTGTGGYSKVELFLEERLSKADVNVKWIRGAEACKSKSIKVQRLAAHRLVYKGFGPKGGWKKAAELFKSRSKKAEDFADGAEGEGDKVPMIATGLLDDQKDPIEKKTIEFEASQPGGVSMDPTSVETKLDTHALAWSFARDVPKDAELELVARVEAALTEFIEDPPYKAEYKEKLSAKTTNKFRIGRPGAYLTIETDEPFVPGSDSYSGGAKLTVEGAAADLFEQLVKIKLQANSITTNEDGGDVPVATGGTVTWTAESDAKAIGFKKVGLDLLITKLGLSAGADGIIGGKVTIPTTEHQAEYSAVLGPEGFMGELSNMPEVELAGMKLEKGAAVVIDMHKGPGVDPQPLPENWPGEGLYIRTAKIYLPESLKGNAEKPPAISASKLRITAAGVTGKLSLEYPIQAGIGKLQFAINKVSLELANNEPTGTQIIGGLSFPDPFIGEAQITLTIQRGNKYALEVGTEKPVASPKLGLVFSITNMVGKYEESLFSFEITSAIVKSEKFSDINIKNFKFDSDGNIAAERIVIGQNIKIGSGFDATLIAFGFKLEKGEYELALETKFEFGDMLTADKVDIKIVTGPSIAEFKLTVTGEKSPVKFGAEINYKANLFEGTLEVDVDKLFKVNGMFVMGAQKTPAGEEWTFWYIELNVRSDKGIPIANTGLSLLGIGGGLGYNYDPPIGLTAGAARKSDAFAFKAAITIGNAPGGEVFAGRLSMVLTSGRFTLNGKVWLLEKEDSLFGEGQVSLYWGAASKMDGYVRMMVALPTAEGKLLRLNGIVDFYYGGGRKEIKSRTLEGALLERVIAEGNIQVTTSKAILEGTLKYDLYKEVPLAVVTVKVQVNLKADAKLEITVSESSANLNATTGFSGNWDVNLYTRVKEFDIVSGSVNARLTLIASNTAVSITGSVRVSWDTWVHSGNTNVDLGYSM